MIEVPIQDPPAVAASLVPEAVVQGHHRPPRSVTETSRPSTPIIQMLGNPLNLPTRPTPGHLHGPNFLQSAINQMRVPTKFSWDERDRTSFPPRHCVPEKHQNQPCLCMTQNRIKFVATSLSQNSGNERSGQVCIGVKSTERRKARVHHCRLWSYSRSNG